MIDLHTHHNRCGHAEGELEDYVKRAIALGLRVIGLSDHAPLFFSADDDPAPGMHMRTSQFGSYLEEAQTLKRRYRGDLEVLVGIEADFIPGTEAAYAGALEGQPIDYVLGAVHYFDGFHVYDPRRWANGADVDAAYRHYLRLVQQAARSGLFDVLAHIDAVKGRAPRAAADASDLIDETVAVIRDCDLAVEINTSGIRKCGEPFPAPGIICKLHEAGVPLTFGSDAHTPDELHHGWRDVQEVLKELGVRELAVFRERQREMLPLEAFAAR